MYRIISDEDLLTLLQKQELCDQLSEIVGINDYTEAVEVVDSIDFRGMMSRFPIFHDGFDNYNYD